MATSDLRDKRDTAAAHTLIGVGIYSVGEAARLLQVPSGKLRRWAEGYTFRRGQTRQSSPPVIAPEADWVCEAPVLTFLDLIELGFVAMFRQEGVSLAVIRAAADRGASLFHTNHPFAVHRFTTDGQTIFAVLKKPGERPKGISWSDLVQDLETSQYVFGKFAEPFFRKIKWGATKALQLWPLGMDKRVVLDPQRALGKPIDAPTGVPTSALFRAIQSGESPAIVANWYEVPLEAVLQSVEYERSLLAA